MSARLVPDFEDVRYDALSRAFHWLTALAVLIAFVLGPEHFGRLMRQGLDPGTRSDIVWHETLGLFVFAMTVARLVWATMRPAPPRAEKPGWTSVAAKSAHVALLALLLLLPATALLALGSEGHPLTVFGGIRVDDIPLIRESAVAKLADWGDVHKFLGDAVMWLAGLHAAAALVHHWWLKDGVLMSMLPRRRRR